VTDSPDTVPEGDSKVLRDLAFPACFALASVCLGAEMKIPNGGFEDPVKKGIPGWQTVLVRQRGSAEVTTEDAHDGLQCVHIRNTGRGPWYLRGQRVSKVQPGKLYVVSAWAKSKTGQARVRIVALNAQGKKTKLKSSVLTGGKASGQWTRIQALRVIPAGSTNLYVEVHGDGDTDLFIDDVSLAPWERPAGRKVEGYTTQRVRESLGRGVVAIPAGGPIHVSWRLLNSDPADAAFDVYRRGDDLPPVKLNHKPICLTTDFMDHNIETGRVYSYCVTLDGRELSPDAIWSKTVRASKDQGSFISLPLQGSYTFSKIGIGDLDGDGRYDFVIKQPKGSVDPYNAPGYWRKSPGTYKMEAYRHDGRFLWRLDLGWSVEQGTWYSPYIVYDLDGDGKCEVVLKTGEGDPREDDGHVLTGPEYLTILEGATGKVKLRTDYQPWRGEAAGARNPYNRYDSRNQLAVAYLDGRTPCLIVERGTYELIIVKAFQLRGGKLEELWTWRSHDWPPAYWGSGSHSIRVGDVDSDGRDEVLIGAAVIDDDGTGLWSTGLGHPDHCYLGDLDPTRPGLEVYYGQELRMDSHGMSMVDAATGKSLWSWPKPTTHVHSSGLVSDIDPTHAGSECYSKNIPRKGLAKPGTEQAWLFDAKGNVLSRDDRGLAPRAAYWDADYQREFFTSKAIRDYDGTTIGPGIEGPIRAIADILGDWREEVITTVEGEIRIYTTPIPATDRRECLMQDRIYRLDVLTQSMGYMQVPTLSYDLATKAAKKAETVIP